jgi:acyl-CoA synthetase (AMP-forming)/AMP-acid ligase II
LAFKEMDVTSLPLAQRTVVFHSSGTTTDRPSRHYHNNESLRLYETSAVHWFGAHFPIGPGEHAFRCLALTPPPSLVPQSSLVHMFKTIRQHGSIGQFDYTGTIDAEGGWTLDLEKTLCLLAASKATPLLLLGTAFSYVQLLDYLATRSDRVRLPPGSAALETGGYKGRSRSLPKNELHAFLAQQLGIPAQRIVSEYGMSELSSQAYDLRMATTTSKPDQETRQDTRVFHFPPWARARIVSVENGQEVGNGEVGLIRVIDLANVWSVLAIQTQDLALRRANGFEMLGRAPGAENRGCSLMSTAS